MRWLTRLVVVLFVLALGGGCADGSDTHDNPDGADRPDRPSASDAQDAPTPDLPLSSAIPGTDPVPSWRHPDMTGWSGPTRPQEGVVTLSRKEDTSSLTTYRWRVPKVTDPRKADRNWLSDYRRSLTQMSGTEVGEATWSTRTVPSSRGTVEFVSLELTYRRSGEKEFRSLFLARHVGPRVFAVNYQAPIGTWSEETWQALLASGLELQL